MKHLKRCAAAALFAAVLGVSGLAQAVTIIPRDLDTISLGTQIAPDISDDFISPSGSDIGDILNRVFLKDDIYTYVHEVTPGISFFSEANTAFDVLGFNGIAGYDFSDAVDAGISFLLNEDPDGTLDWEVVNGGEWTAGESIALFFQSTLPPGLGDYNVINGQVGTATSYAPSPQVSEPAMLGLFGLGLIGAAAFGRRRRA